ncbi:hypothetical protein [Bosea sp. (in: a-proteobacteria)]|uniref:hypothetical protein n=1 Tax=Bosea sp. (in: a-proteobacteria) TaxID=1871050 RepID=UPI003F6E4FED
MTTPRQGDDRPRETERFAPFAHGNNPDRLSDMTTQPSAPGAQGRGAGGAAGWFLALVLLALFAVGVILALSMPLRLPLGAFYWDAAVYLDAFQRIHVGQMPAVDLFAPV